MKATLLLGLVGLAIAALAEAPPVFNVQGRLVVNGTNFAGTGQFKFALVDGTGSATYWSNGAGTVSLPVTRGLYAALLGDTNTAGMSAVPASVFQNPDVRLRVWFDDGVSGWQLLSPDQRLAAAPYAMLAAGVQSNAIDAASLADGAVTANKLATGAVSASAILTGTLVDARLGTNVALLNGNQTFSGSVGFSGMTATQLTSRTAGGSLVVKALNGTGNGGALTVSAGTGGTGSGGAGGNLNLLAGHAMASGGSGYGGVGPAGVVNIVAGNGYNSVGGDVVVQSGGNSPWSLTANAYSRISLQGGTVNGVGEGAVLDVEGARNPHTDGTQVAAGGNVKITAGNATGAYAGGNILLTPGSGSPAGNVGIGTTSPTNKLHVVGTVQATGFVGSGAGLGNLNGSNINAGTVGAATLADGAVSNVKLANSSLTVLAGNGLAGGGTVALGGTVTLSNAGVLSVGASAPLSSSGGQSTVLSLPQANASQPGYMSTNDWRMFAAKLDSNTWAAADATTNIVRRTGDSMTGPLTNRLGFAGNGAGLTNLSASVVASGTLGDARLSTNVALLNGNQSFSGTVGFGGLTATQVTSRTAGESLVVKALNGTGNGGALTVSAGTGGTGSGGAGGNLNLLAGHAMASGGSGYGGVGPAGVVNIVAGSGYNSVGGDVVVQSGGNSPWSLTANAYSRISLQGGTVNGTGEGAVLEIEGARNPRTDGTQVAAGGNVKITAGNATGAYAGGNIILTPGSGSPAGNVGIGTTSPTNKLHVVGTVQATGYITSSDRNAKADVMPVCPEDILAKVLALPISTWVFTYEDTGRHLGPMAQDFRAAFGLGNTDGGIFTVDADGVALAAIQALKSENDRLRAELEALRMRLDRIAPP